MKIIGIAGGSGSGKSTVAALLSRKYPEKCSVLHLDDYFKRSAQAPMLGGFTNWDHPDAISFDDVYRDLCALKRGESVIINTKSELYNPNYVRELKNTIEHELKPTEYLIVEGYLAFWDDRVRSLMEKKIYLDIAIEESSKRRSTNKFALNEDYFLNVLVPMHTQYVVPTKQYADVVLDVSQLSPEEVLREVERIIGIFSV